jgi:hypothetical protein
MEQRASWRLSRPSCVNRLDRLGVYRLAMRDLPLKARLFLVATIVCGLLSILPVFYVQVPPTSAPTWELVVYIGLGILTAGRKIRLFRSNSDHDAGSMSLGFTIGYAAMLRFGPPGGFLVHTLCCLSACVYLSGRRFTSSSST